MDRVQESSGNSVQINLTHMKILALILARGGSKRCPGKNIRNLGGKPLIEWSIDSAKKVSEISDILVSTDDEAIAEIAKKAGANVPWLRPSSLSTDTATSIDATIHAIDWYELEQGYLDAILLLQPTSPFRTSKTILAGIELYKSNKVDSVVGVSKAHSHPEWAFKISHGILEPFFNRQSISKRSQDLSPAFIANGAFYLTSVETIRNEKTFFPEKTAPLEIESHKEALDIDDEWDFQIAEKMIDKEGL